MAGCNPEGVTTKGTKITKDFFNVDIVTLAVFVTFVVFVRFVAHG